MVVDLADLVVQLLCAVKQSHDKDVCHGERIFLKQMNDPSVVKEVFLSIVACAYECR